MARGRMIPLCLAAVALGGCGYSAATAPSLTDPAPPQGFRPLVLTRAGLSLRVPRSWTLSDQGHPLVAVISSGPAVIALWRYRRDGPLPRGSELETALQRLLGAVRARQPDIRKLRARVVHLAGVHGIELSLMEPIAGRVMRIRSTHLFAGRSEVVLETYAPPRTFGTVDRQVFLSVRASLRISSPGTAPPP